MLAKRRGKMKNKKSHASIWDDKKKDCADLGSNLWVRANRR